MFPYYLNCSSAAGSLIISAFLMLCAVASLLLSARKFAHYFQLESYQFHGYFKTLRRQDAFVSSVRLAALHLANSALFAGLQLVISRIEDKDYQQYLTSMEMPNYINRMDSYALASFLSVILFGLLAVLIGWLFRRHGMKRAEKKKFALTARMKRFYAAFLLLLLLLEILLWYLLRTQVHHNEFLSIWGFLGHGNILLALLLPLLVALAGVIAIPVERLIFHLYFRDAEKKLLENDRLIRIGITGSYGKTSTKFILAEILSQKYNVLATPASYNTPMGVTRVIRERLTPSHQVFIGEMGARHVGEIKELSRLVHPEIGILTAVGPQHLDTFKTLERIEKTKYELIDALPRDGMAVFLHDGDIVTRLYKKTQKPKMLAGREGADAWAEDVRVSPAGSHFTLCLRGWEPLECQTVLLGEHNIRNILTAAAVAKYLGLTREQLARGIQSLRPVEHRLQLLKTAGGVSVIDDAFNTNPRSSKEALKVLSSFPGRHVIVTPGMVELGGQEDRFNEEFGRDMADKVDIAVLVGRHHTAPIQKGLLSQGFPPENIFVAASLNEAIVLVNSVIRPGDVVMYENDLPDHYNES